MGITCTRCQNSGFLNIEQIPEQHIRDDVELVLAWITEHTDHDVQVCDCCGDGQNHYREPGEHSCCDYGPHGPYAYNGGLPECY